MKLVKQFTILVITCFIGEILHAVIPLPVPASIYGLVLMFVALQTKIMPLSAVDQASDALLSIMPLLFIPSTVGLILAWDILKARWLQFLIIGIVGSMIVFFTAGHVTQLVIKIMKRGKKND